MGTNNDYQNRLPEHEEPLRIEAHEEDTPAPARKPRRRRQAATADIDEVRGVGGVGWALLTLVAAAIVVGAVYFFSPQGYGLGHGRATRYSQAVTTPAAPATVYGTQTIIVEQPAEALAATEARDISAAPATTDATATTAAAGDVIHLFPLNGSAIPDDADLNRVAAAAKKTGSDVTVTGYTDESGSVAYNKRLAARRAARVADYLVSHGVPRAHVHAKGAGPTHNYPTPAQNRCAVVHVGS